MQAMRFSSPLVGSSFSSSPVFQNDRSCSCRQASVNRLHVSTFCQLDRSKFSASAFESTRRSLMIATMVSITGATAAALITEPDFAQAAGKRKVPPPPEQNKAEDEKYLSAYDAKVLANLRRKEALKAQLETQKAKAKTVQQPPLDIFGQAGVSE